MRSQLGGGSPLSSSIIIFDTATHRSQIKTRGPATSFSTSAALLPQNEQASFLRKNINFQPPNFYVQNKISVFSLLIFVVFAFKNFLSQSSQGSTQRSPRRDF